MNGVAERLTTLASMSPTQLRTEWRRTFRAVAPQLTPDLLARGIAYRIQEKAFGGLSRAARHELERLADPASRAKRQSNASIKPGTRLVRSWGGKTHAVLVTDDGFLFDGQNHRSLSAIAETITGARWSGPRFFGLTRRSSKPEHRHAA